MISELAARNHLWQALLPAGSVSSLEAVSPCLTSRRLFFPLIYLGMDPKVFTLCPLSLSCCTLASWPEWLAAAWQLIWIATALSRTFRLMLCRVTNRMRCLNLWRLILKHLKGSWFSKNTMCSHLQKIKFLKDVWSWELRTVSSWVSCEYHSEKKIRFFVALSVILIILLYVSKNSLEMVWKSRLNRACFSSLLLLCKWADLVLTIFWQGCIMECIDSRCVKGGGLFYWRMSQNGSLL